MWSGHNYAYEVVRHLGIDEREGVLRIGLAHYNTEEEVASTLKALQSALSEVKAYRERWGHKGDMGQLTYFHTHTARASRRWGSRRPKTGPEKGQFT